MKQKGRSIMPNTKDKIKGRYNRIAGMFDRMDRMIKPEWRSGLLAEVSGNVLETGIGTGGNLSYYPKGISLTGIDFSPGMLKYARKKVHEQQYDFSIELLEADIQKLPFQDNTFDFVVSTCVFCSVPDPVEGLRELRRVCKSTGKIVMLEHMRSEDKWLGFAMDIMNPLVVRLWGANINRRTLDNIHKAGLTVEENEMLMGSILRQLAVAPNK